VSAAALVVVAAIAAESPPDDARARLDAIQDLPSLWAATAPAEAPLPGTLRTLRVRGLEATEESVVRRELGWSEGEAVDEHAWRLGLARLWNTVLFSRIEARRVPVAPDVFDVEVEVHENYTLFPIFTGTATRDLVWVRAGLMELNLLGKYREVGFSVERFNDAYGGDLYFRNPRLGGERVERLELLGARSLLRLEAVEAPLLGVDALVGLAEGHAAEDHRQRERHDGGGVEPRGPHPGLRAALEVVLVGREDREEARVGRALDDLAREHQVRGRGDRAEEERRQQADEEAEPAEILGEVEHGRLLVRPG